MMINYYYLMSLKNFQIIVISLPITLVANNFIIIFIKIIIIIAPCGVNMNAIDLLLSFVIYFQLFYLSFLKFCYIIQEFIIICLVYNYSFMKYQKFKLIQDSFLPKVV